MKTIKYGLSYNNEFGKWNFGVYGFKAIATANHWEETPEGNFKMKELFDTKDELFDTKDELLTKLQSFGLTEKMAKRTFESKYLLVGYNIFGQLTTDYIDRY